MKPEDTGTGTSLLDDEAVARLIESAGPRPPIPAEDLDAIAASARAAWQAKARPGATAARSEVAGEPGSESTGGAMSARWQRAGARRAPLRRGRPLAIAAVLLGLALGLALAVRWASRPDVVQQPPAVAILESTTGALLLDVGGTTRRIGLGDAVPLGALVRTGGDRDGGGAPGGARPVRAALRMHGGASVRLDARTAVRLASASRIDLLGGALYADTGRRLDVEPERGAVAGAVAQAGASPALEIRTDLGIARDVGTRFMVRRMEREGGPALEVLVRDGAVALERGGESAVAAAGERLIAGGDGAVERRAISPYGPEWAWVMDAAAPVALEGRNFADILEWVSSETGWTIRYEDPAVAEVARRAVLEGGGSAAARALRPDQAPFVLLETARLEGVVEDGVLTVRRLR